MPNRILRDTTDSEKVNSVSVGAEVTMYRLFMKADDFGSYHANPKLIKSTLFPLKDNIRETDISRWLDELQMAGLILFYVVGEKKLLRVINFGQRLRNMRNAFPHPLDDNSQQFAATRSDSPPETKRNETEVETETKANRTHAQEGFFLNQISKEMELSVIDFSNVKEFIRAVCKIEIKDQEINDYWKAFRADNFGKKEWYNDREKLISHFRHTLKNQLNKNGTNIKSSQQGNYKGKSAGAYELLDDIRPGSPDE